MKRRNYWSFEEILILTVLPCATLLFAITTVSEGVRPPGPSAQPEAYFNGSSYVRLSRSVSLHSLSGVSFRSCVGGELFSQRYESHTLQITALFDQVVAAFVTPQRGRREFRVRTHALDNRWHFVGLEYDATGKHPQLALTVDSDKSVVIANWTFNTDILSSPHLEDESAVLIVGNMFSGCMREGPGLLFQPGHMIVQNVAFGPCPLTTDECKDRKDVLTIPPVDHCYHEPCMRHGTCISRLDRYECHCAVRYAGNNCQIDNGPPCLSLPCKHASSCEETKLGDYVCHCAKGYHGTQCELEISVHPLCVAGPCRHNGSCDVAPGTDYYVCTCQPGYTGKNCEQDVDECADTPDACNNGGRCIDGPNNYTCDCSGTGYEGARCESNVDECERDGAAACTGHGVCYDTYGGYVCQCDEGYDGKRCQITLSACASLQCANGGTCSESETGATCLCPRGFTGPKCRRTATCRDLQCPVRSRCVDAGNAAGQAHCVCEKGFYGAPGLSPNCTSLPAVCLTSPCNNGGTCTVDLAHDNFNCTCAPGYHGVYCEQSLMAKSMSELTPGESAVVASVLRCADEPCVHASMCHDYSSGYRCECDSGWMGVDCDVKAGQGQGCAARPCHNAAECTDTMDGGYHCHCLPGYTGKQCSRLAPLGAADPCPCQHGGTCRLPPLSALPPTNVVCECPPGYEGALCERRSDNCRDIKCNKGQVCVETAVGVRCRCPDGYSGPDCAVAQTGACAMAPCGNGTCKETNATKDNFTCTCDPGYTGRYCESDIDECKIPHICNEGICVNKPGRFQCYCTPGYTGDHCEVDFDECLSHPCKNNGTCQNKINNFECICMPGFTGKDCFVNIDECKPNPCEANSTCIDGVATFSCVCPEGLTGKTCEINIDDCEMMPCQHGGHCTDGRNSYSCDCTGTGYAGPDCRDNIDDCAPDPCRNGATCVDAVNDYHCACYSGYTGKNCEIDIPECESSPCQYNGVCLERSNASLYVPPPADPTTDPVQVGDEPNMLLPHSFYTDFSYENASGLECVCVNGVVGSRCEINVNECESTPCGPWGTCVDRVGRYECECHDGFEGDHCQIDIDECDRYKPCFHGNCYDRRASYYCECEAGWGGHNCSVALVGCVEQPCLNGGACRPWLQHETTHRFNCTCEAGYHGTTCEKITTMSLSGHSYVAVNTTRDEGYDIQFRFRTTIGNGLLAIGKGLTYYILELVNGRLNLHSSLLNKWEGVFIGSNLADSKWQKVFVTINSSHLVLAANEEQTIYPINLNEGSNSSHTSFPTTFLGGTVSSLSRLTHGPSYFVGCMQDVTINGEWVLPDNLEQGVTTETPLLVVDDVTSSSAGGASWLLHSINASCSRTPQCDPNPCHSSGTCQDLWTAFRCTCQRPYLGHTCQYNLKSATFGHESTKSRSVVTVAVYDAARKAVRSVLDISMFIRTRQPTGHIFYIGSKPRSPSMAGYDETSVAASLVGGELVVHLRFNQTPEDYTVGGTRLDNGYDHLIQVMRNSMLVQVKLNGTEYFRKSISAARQLDAQVLYLGGPPPLPLFTPPTPSALPASVPSPPVLSSRTSRVARSISSPLMRTSRSPVLPPPPSPAPAPPHAEETVTAPDATVSAYSPADFFKGIIQDVQVSNGSYSMFVEFFPLQEPDLELPAPFGAVSFDPQVVLEGVVSDDSCAALPCRHNGTCKVTWNDYRCICPRGYKGKSCDEMEFCQLQDCPVNSVCRNLDGGYECLANATFDGRNTTLMYKMDVSINVLSSDEMTLPPVAPRLDSLLITYRSKTGGTLFHASYGSSLFSLGVYRDRVTVQWRLGGGGNAVGMAPQPALPQLRRFNKETPDYQWTTIHILIADSQIKGGFYDWQKDDTPAFTAEIDTLAWLELITRGNIFLGGVGTSDARGPIDTRSANLSQDALSHRSLYSMDAVDFTGRSLQPELVTETGLYEMSGESKWNYDETLGESFKGCIGQVRIGDLLLPFFTSDELYVGQTPPPLHNLAHFSLQQSRKTHQYATLGCVLCFEWDCLNGGHCEDITSQYSCKCPVGFAGDNCKVNIDECEGGNAACQNNGTCQDGVGNFTCLCPTGWDGWLCDVNVDECLSSPCAHGGSCVDAAGSFSCICPPQWAGRTCAAPHRRTCAQLPCGPNGNCRDTPSDPITGNNFTCDCSPGYEGLLCDIPFCLNRLCQHGGQCIADIGEPHCKCKAGYEGVLCEKEINECVVAGAEPCQHGGRCVDRLASYECDCTHTGYRGVYCQTDVDECQEGLVDCGTGRCVNTNGSYICECTEGYCGFACALADPCFAPQDTDVVSDEPDTNTSLAHGPCQNGGACTQRCSAQVDYECHCIDGWGGKNCTQQVVWGAGGDASSNAGTIAIAVGAALGAALLAGAALAALAANARSKRATRGTYSPSSQEYCNPRLEMLDNALKPPPEERLI